MLKVEQLLEVPQGQFVLRRLPERPRELLQAWDAADEYLLAHVDAAKPADNASILVVNDTFGALAVALSRYQLQAWSDSFLSQQATRLNLQANQVPVEQVKLVNSLAMPAAPFDWVLIKAPKTLALLEYQLLQLRPYLSADTQIVVAGMVKALPSSVWTLLARLIGSTSTSLAKKKARLIFAQLDSNLITPANPYPICYTLENTAYRIANHANVFSRDSLDIGTRFFLQHLPASNSALDVIDLGCGNGVVGLMAAVNNSAAAVHFIDESFMAVASAQENFHAAFADTRQATFAVGDGLTGFASASADLILCNPPFHQHNTVGDQLAQSMFRESLRVLRNGGELWVVGNRHLDYHANLKRLFKNCTLVDSNAKFVVLKARLIRQ